VTFRVVVAVLLTGGLADGSVVADADSGARSGVTFAGGRSGAGWLLARGRRAGGAGSWEVRDRPATAVKGVRSVLMRWPP